MTTSFTDALELISTLSSKNPLVIKHLAKITELSWSPRDHILATASNESNILLWNTSEVTEEPRILPIPGAAHAISWSPDGEFLAVGTQSGKLMLASGYWR